MFSADRYRLAMSEASILRPATPDEIALPLPATIPH
jgi:hypothetical protein